jgi:hypothetical protein
VRKSYFNKVSLKTTGFSSAYAKIGLKISQSPNRILDEQIRVKTEKSFFLNIAKQIINTCLTFLGTGDTIKAFYKK